MPGATQSASCCEIRNTAVIQGRAKLGGDTPLYQYRCTFINKKQPCNFRARAGTKALRFRNLAPFRVTDSRPGHSIVLKISPARCSAGIEASTHAWTHGMAADSLVLKLQGCFLFTKVQRYWYNGVSPPSLARPCITAVFRISQQLMR